MVSVTDWNDLDSIRSDMSGTHTLQNDLDSTTAGYSSLASSTANSGAGWEPLGDFDSKFLGSFDGNGNSISDMVIDRTSGVMVGLFGTITGTVQNLNVLDADVTGADHDTGILAAFIDGDATVSNCHVTGTIDNSASTASAWTGAITGAINDFNDTGNQPVVSDCSTNADVIGANQYTGGFVGGLFKGTVQRCSASGTVNNNDTDTGGFAGSLEDMADLLKSYSDATIQSGGTNVGGLIGNSVQINSDTPLVQDCYAIGDIDVSGASNVGGLIGSTEDNSTVERCYAAQSTANGVDGGLIGTDINSATVTDSFWDTESSGISTSAGGTGKTTAEMQDVNTYTDTATAGLTTAWDLEDVVSHSTELWIINDENTYPAFSRDTAEITGTITLNSSAVDGATVIGVNDTDGYVADITSTDVNGDYSLTFIHANIAHAMVQYDDGAGNQYNAESKPFIVI